MKTLPKLTIGAMILAGTATLILLLAGCGDNPVKPVTQENNQTQLGFDESQFNGPLAKGGAWSLVSARDSANVGQAGGWITLNFGKDTSTLFIPPGAVCPAGGTCRVEITAQASEIRTPAGRLFLYDFGPDGQQFARPCNLSVSSGFAPGAIVRLYWFNPETNVWVLLQQIRADRLGGVRFTINHFSKYGIS